MKKITLHGPAVRNDGSYVDAGETLTIGDGADEINSDRAADLVERGVAFGAAEAARIEKASVAIGNDPIDDEAAAVA